MDASHRTARRYTFLRRTATFFASFFCRPPTPIHSHSAAQRPALHTPNMRVTTAQTARQVFASTVPGCIATRWITCAEAAATTAIYRLTNLHLRPRRGSYAWTPGVYFMVSRLSCHGRLILSVQSNTLTRTNAYYKSFRYLYNSVRYCPKHGISRSVECSFITFAAKRYRCPKARNEY
jgi:hypothetical protein